MIDVASTPPAKTRITHGQQQRWLEDSLGFLQNGESPAAIDAFLRNEGCPPRLRQDLLRQANARLRGEQRGAGLRTVGLGVGVIALGAAVYWWAVGGQATSLHGELHYGGRLGFAGGVIAFVGLQVCLVGAWKMLTGSRVDLVAEIR